MKIEKQERLPKFSERLALLQAQNGKGSISDFADFLGLSRQTVGFYLAGERLPDAKILSMICEKCRISADWLLGLSEDKPIDPEENIAQKYIGLSDKAMNNLKKLREDGGGLFFEMLFNRLMESNQLLDLVYRYYTFIRVSELKRLYEAADPQKRDNAEYWQNYLNEHGFALKHSDVCKVRALLFGSGDEKYYLYHYPSLLINEKDIEMYRLVRIFEKIILEENGDETNGRKPV